jgi:hypothetical protein
MMHDFERGFRIDGTQIGWGATMAEAAEKLRQPAEGERVGYSQLRVGCRAVSGFDSVGAELSGHGLSRPVTAIAYDLALPADGPIEPRFWTGPLCKMLGKPDKETIEDIGDRSNPGDAVRFYCNWERGDFSVGLSVFGGPREVEGGVAAAILWLSWRIERAAAPFLADWRTACESLAVAAKDATKPRIFQVGFDQHALHGGGREPAGKAKLAREAWLALAAPDVLLTPPAIGSKLSKRQFALWSNLDMKVHCLSTRWDSIIWDAGVTPRIDWWLVLPAKGPGQSSLHAGNWSVMDFTNSSSVPEAVEALDRIPGVKVNRLDGGYDC